MEKIYRVQTNSEGVLDFSTAVEMEKSQQGEWITYYPFMMSIQEQKFYGAKNPTEPIPDKRLGRIKCNICGNPKPLGESNYCPNCGARMKGVDDE